MVKVFDTKLNESKNFSCSKDKVISRMRYFDSFLGAGKSVEDLDITVQCDIKIFEWLVNYLNDVVGEGRSLLAP